MIKRGAGGGEGRGLRRAAQFVRRNYESFKEGINLKVSERMHGKRGTGGAAQSMRANYTSLKGIHVTVLERMHQFVMVIALYLLSQKETTHRGRSYDWAKALGGGHEKIIAGKKFLCHSGNGAILETLSLKFLDHALHTPKSKNSSRLYRPK